MRIGFPSTLLIAAILLAGCSQFPSTKDEYKQSKSIAYLKTPEGIKIPKPDKTYRVPEVEKQPDGGASESRQSSEPASLVPGGGGRAANKDDQQMLALRKKVKPDEPAVVASRVPPPVERKAVKATEEKASETVTAPNSEEVQPVFVVRQTLTDKMKNPASPRSSSQPAAGKAPPADKAIAKAATARNWFELRAPPEKVWAKLAGYWMERKIPVIESNPQTGVIKTDWVTSSGSRGLGKGLRDQYEIQLARSPIGSKVTLIHRASKMSPVSGSDKPQWTLLGSDLALQGAETARLRSYLTGQ